MSRANAARALELNAWVPGIARRMAARIVATNLGKGANPQLEQRKREWLDASDREATEDLRLQLAQVMRIKAQAASAQAAVRGADQGERCSRGAESACTLSAIAASTSRHLPDSCAAPIAFSSARRSRTLGATLIWAMAPAGLPARSSAITLSDQAGREGMRTFVGTRRALSPPAPARD